MSGMQPQDSWPGAQGAPPVPGLPRSNGLAVASLVLGLIAIVLFCIWYISAPCAILAVVFGFIGRSRADEGAPHRGLATAGLILGCVAIGLVVLIIVLAFAGIALLGATAPELLEAAERAAEQAANQTPQ